MHRRMDAWLLVAATLAACLAPTDIPGGEIRLSDGTVLRGKIRPQQSLALSKQRSAGELTTYPIVAAVTPLKRYFVPTRLVAELNNDADLDLFVANGHVYPQIDRANLGVRYANGQGVEQNDAEAVKWYRLAAKQNHVEAQLVLGYRYQRGEGVPRDYVLSYMWFELAVSRASEAIRGRAIRARNEVTEFLTLDEREDAKARALKWDSEHPLH